MNALLRAEARRLRTTRSVLAMAGLATAYPALGVMAAALAGQAPPEDSDALVEILRGGAGVMTMTALVLGILTAAGEYRHGTIVPTFLVAPRRGRWLAAKLVSQAALGMTLGLASSAVGLVAGTSYLVSRGIPVDVLSSDVVLTIGAVTLVGSFYATAGTAVGALVRNQTAAVAGALIWVLTVENAMPVVLGDPGLRRWLPGGAADRLLHLADGASAMGAEWAALAMLGGLTAVLAAAATVTTRSADVR